MEATVDFPPRAGEMVIVGHDYYRVVDVTWSGDMKTGLMLVRISVVDMMDVKTWREHAHVAIVVVCVVLLALGLTWCAVGLG